MFPEDTVLIAYVPTPADFNLIQQERWYRIPVAQCPKGIYADYIGFYFGQNFGSQKWGIHYFAPIRGHELVRRIDLFPDQPDHARAKDRYFKVQLGKVRPRGEPIVSLSWRRLLFLHTTWDRFCTAKEITDLTMGVEPLHQRGRAIRERGEISRDLLKPANSRLRDS